MRETARTIEAVATGTAPRGSLIGVSLEAAFVLAIVALSVAPSLRIPGSIPGRRA